MSRIHGCVPVWAVAIFDHDRIFDFCTGLRRVPVTVPLGKSFVPGPCGQGEDDFQQQADSIMKAIAALMPPDYHRSYSGGVNKPGLSG